MLLWFITRGGAGRDDKKEATEARHATRGLGKDLEELRQEMLAAAEALEFERAAELRDRILDLEDAALGIGGPLDLPEVPRDPKKERDLKRQVKRRKKAKKKTTRKKATGKKKATKKKAAKKKATKKKATKKTAAKKKTTKKKAGKQPVSQQASGNADDS